MGTVETDSEIPKIAVFSSTNRYARARSFLVDKSVCENSSSMIKRIGKCIVPSVVRAATHPVASCSYTHTIRIRSHSLMMSLHTYGRTKTAAVPGRGSHCTIQSRASYAYDHAKKELCLSTWAHPATSADTFVTCCHGAGRLSNLQYRQQQHTVAQETCTTENTNHINAAYTTDTTPLARHYLIDKSRHHLHSYHQHDNMTKKGRGRGRRSSARKKASRTSEGTTSAAEVATPNNANEEHSDESPAARAAASWEGCVKYSRVSVPNRKPRPTEVNGGYIRAHLESSERVWDGGN